MNANRKLLAAVVGTEHDHEWYPTTNEIIQSIKSDIEKDESSFNGRPSILDCGAGDGRVLNALTDGKRYAIEKSEPLLSALDRGIFVVGTEFHQQTLIDKKVDIVFSNPPYSEFAKWAVKIINEANAELIYLVIPERWKDSAEINASLKMREAKASVIGAFDFLEADRAARAKVNIIKVELAFSRRYVGGPKVDPFKLWYDNHFSIHADSTEQGEHAKEQVKKQTQGEKIKHELVNGGDLIQVLDKLYHKEMASLIDTYKKLESLDPELLRELDVNHKAVCGGLQLKIAGLKDRYWKELFNNMEKITVRLTVASRKRLFDILTEHTHIDFTPTNAYAIMVWVLKNANHYYDDQLTDTVESMVDAANIRLYKSNHNTYGKDQWRYCSRPDGLNKFSLEYRLVMHRVGGIACSPWGWENPKCGLQSRAIDFLNDLRTVASNLGFDTNGFSGIEAMRWKSGKKNIIVCSDTRRGEDVALFEAKAFMNGNLHIKFNQRFIKALNVEFGRLKGWLKSTQQAADELSINLDEVEASFSTNHQIATSDMPMLLGYSGGT